MKFIKGQQCAKNIRVHKLLMYYGLRPNRLIPHVSDEWHPGYPPFVIGDAWIYAKTLTCVGTIHWTPRQKKAIIKSENPIFAVVFTSDYLKHCLQKIELDEKDHVICKDPTKEDLEALKLNTN